MHLSLPNYIKSDIPQAMTVRKLQKTGGASLSIIIPKKWADNLNLTDKSELFVDNSNPNFLKLSPTTQSKKNTHFTINAQSLITVKIIREVIAAYLAGVDQVVIENLSLDTKQHKRLHQLCSSLIGFEIIDESSTKIILQNVFDSDKFPVTKNLEKMFLMTKSMFDDTITALTNLDNELSLSVIEREQEIDKFHLAITRQFHVYLKDELGKTTNKLNVADLYFFSLISRQLERIADHCVKICKLTKTIDSHKNQFPDLSIITNEVSQTIFYTKETILNLNNNDAHEILDKCTNLTKKISALQTTTTKPTLAFNLACDSLDRICGYLTNIAEATLDQKLITST